MFGEGIRCEVLSRVTPEDSATIARLLGQLTARGESPAVVAEQMEAIMGGGSAQIFVARCGNVIVGVMAGYLCDHLSRSFSPFLVLEALVVDEAQRNRGIGHQLMAYTEQWAAGQSVRYIMLASQQTRKDAHRFYESLGYCHDAAFQKFLDTATE